MFHRLSLWERRVVLMVVPITIELAEPSIAYADALAVEPKLVVPKGLEQLCNRPGNFAEYYHNSVRWLRFTGQGRAPGAASIEEMSPVSVNGEIIPANSGGFVGRIRIVTAHAIIEEKEPFHAGMECSAIAAELANWAAHIVLHRQRGPLPVETDYDVRIEPAANLAACNDPSRFRWFFERLRVNHAFAPRHPRTIVVQLEGGLSTQIKAQVSILPSDNRDYPPTTESKRFVVVGPTDCATVLHDVAVRILLYELGGTAEPLASLGHQDARFQPQWQISAGPIVTTMTPGGSPSQPILGLEAKVQYRFTRDFDLQGVFKTFQPHFTTIGAQERAIQVLGLNAFGLAVCERSVGKLGDLGGCIGPRASVWTVAGSGLLAPKQGTGVYGAGSLRLFIEPSIWNSFRPEFFVEGTLFFQRPQVRGRQEIIVGPWGEITVGVNVPLSSASPQP